MGAQPPRSVPQGVPAQFALTLLQEVAAIGGEPDGLLARLRLPFTQADLVAGRPDLLFPGNSRCCTVFAAPRRCPAPCPRRGSPPNRRRARS